MIRLSTETRPLERIVHKVVQPLLESAGFRRKRLTWNRPRRDFIDVFNVQTERSRLGPNTFTINVGIFMPDLFQFVLQTAPARFVEEPDCVVRARIGELLSRDGADKARDKWWDLDSETEELNCGRELGDVLPERVLPFLESFQSVRDVHGYLERQKGWQSKYILNRLFLAAARHKVGDTEGGLRELSEIGNAGAWTKNVERLRRAILDERVGHDRS